jgi:hypothetical protein
MAGTELNAFLRHLRRVLERQEGVETPDADLLRRYAGHGDESAFEVLVQGYGPMVLGVCRRILSNPLDAEDAFQATFLVLVSKAANLRLHSTLGNWLYGVACRTAQHARHAAINGKVFVERPRVWALPRGAVERMGASAFYWGYALGRVVRTEVQTGVSDGNWIEVVKRRSLGSSDDD